MPRFRLLDRNPAAGIQAALDEGNRTGPVPAEKVKAVLSALEAEWEAERNPRADG